MEYRVGFEVNIFRDGGLWVMEQFNPDLSVGKFRICPERALPVVP